jgi:hypothetical protein
LDQPIFAYFTPGAAAAESQSKRLRWQLESAGSVTQSIVIPSLGINANNGGQIALCGLKLTISRTLYWSVERIREKVAPSLRAGTGASDGEIIVLLA